MKRYMLNKNFALIECQNECLVHSSGCESGKKDKKEKTLYLNKTAFLILKELLKNKTVEEIEEEIGKNFLFVKKEDKNNLLEQINITIEKLEKSGIIFYEN